MGLVPGTSLSDQSHIVWTGFLLQNLVTGTLQLDFVAKMASSHNVTSPYDLLQGVVAGTSPTVCPPLFNEGLCNCDPILLTLRKCWTCSSVIEEKLDFDFTCISGKQVLKTTADFYCPIGKQRELSETLASLSCVMWEIMLPSNHKDMFQRLSWGIFFKLQIQEKKVYIIFTGLN